jgi:hypothetical protein
MTFLSSPRRPDRLWGPTKLPIQWVPGIKQPGPEADNSRPTSAEVKKTWIYTSTSHTPSWRSAQLVKHRDNFTSFYTLSPQHFILKQFKFLSILKVRDKASRQYNTADIFFGVVYFNL